MSRYLSLLVFLLTLFLVLTSSIHAQDQDDIDPGDAPDFIPAAPTLTTIKSFPAKGLKPVVILSQDGESLIIAVSTEISLDFRAQVSPDLKTWSEAQPPAAVPGNGSIRTFMINLAADIALFVRVAVF